MPCWVEVSLYLRIGRLCSGIWTDWIDGLRPTVGGSTSQVLGPAIPSKQPHAKLQAWGGVAGKLPKGKGPGDACQQLAEHEPAVCPGGQEGQRHPGLYQE